MYDITISERFQISIFLNNLKTDVKGVSVFKKKFKTNSRELIYSCVVPTHILST